MALEAFRQRLRPLDVEEAPDLSPQRRALPSARSWSPSSRGARASLLHRIRSPSHLARPPSPSADSNWDSDSYYSCSEAGVDTPRAVDVDGGGGGGGGDAEEEHPDMFAVRSEHERQVESELARLAEEVASQCEGNVSDDDRAFFDAPQSPKIRSPKPTVTPLSDGYDVFWPLHEGSEAGSPVAGASESGMRDELEDGTVKVKEYINLALTGGENLADYEYQSTGIYIRGLDRKTSAEEIQELFTGAWGKVLWVKSHAPRKYAFVEFGHPRPVNEIMRMPGDSWVLRGKQLTVKERREWTQADIEARRQRINKGKEERRIMKEQKEKEAFERDRCAAHSPMSARGGYASPKRGFRPRRPPPIFLEAPPMIAVDTGAGVSYPAVYSPSHASQLSPMVRTMLYVDHEDDLSDHAPSSPVQHAMFAASPASMYEVASPRAHGVFH